jgi:hypothetical protein
MFAGSCIGVLLLVMLLELLRRMVKEYDALLVRKHSTTNNVGAPAAAGRAQQGGSDSGESKNHALSVQPVGTIPSGRFRPTVLEQAVRALLHMCQFAVAYFVMLYAIPWNPPPFRHIHLAYFCMVDCDPVRQIWRSRRVCEWDMSQWLTCLSIIRLAMYYNGYIIICIFLGAFLGSFVFHYEYMGQE